MYFFLFKPAKFASKLSDIFWTHPLLISHHLIIQMLVEVTLGFFKLYLHVSVCYAMTVFFNCEIYFVYLVLNGNLLMLSCFILLLRFFSIYNKLLNDNDFICVCVCVFVRLVQMFRQVWNLFYSCKIPKFYFKVFVCVSMTPTNYVFPHKNYNFRFGEFFEESFEIVGCCLKWQN